jgi:N-acyl-D-aspartate/D-glutamate deacylase
MFLTIPGWWEVMAQGDRADKVAALRDPATRARLAQSMNGMGAVPGLSMDPRDFVVRQVALDRNDDLVGRSLGEIATERGSTPADALIDIALDEDLGTWFLRSDVGHTDVGAVGGLLAHPHVHIGASDAGAHVGTFATYGDTGLLFSQFVGGAGQLTLEGAVKKITSDPCRIWGLPQRGELTAGYAADVVVFDPATIGRGPEVLADDFPGGFRWVRKSEGVETVIVNGAVTWTKDEGYTTARPGAVVTH